MAGVGVGEMKNLGWGIKLQVFERAEYICCYCGIDTLVYEQLYGRRYAASIEHIIPRIKGGTDDLENLACACLCCNKGRRDRDINDFKRYLEERDNEMVSAQLRCQRRY